MPTSILKKIMMKKQLILMIKVKKNRRLPPFYLGGSFFYVQGLFAVISFSYKTSKDFTQEKNELLNPELLIF